MDEQEQESLYFELRNKFNTDAEFAEFMMNTLSDFTAYIKHTSDCPTSQEAIDNIYGSLEGFEVYLRGHTTLPLMKLRGIN